MDDHSRHIEKNIFRILTVEELDELASTKKEYKSVPLTKIMSIELEETGQNLEEEFGNDEKIEIVEMEKVRPESGTDGSMAYNCADNVADVLAEYNYYCQEAEKKIFSPSVRKKKRSRKVQISKLILEERKKLEEINYKLKRQEIIKRYRANSNAKLGNKKESKNEYPPSERSGILIKKQI